LVIVRFLGEALIDCESLIVRSRPWMVLVGQALSSLSRASVLAWYTLAPGAMLGIRL
jgi:hypothetical protein